MPVTISWMLFVAACGEMFTRDENPSGLRRARPMRKRVPIPPNAGHDETTGWPLFRLPRSPPLDLVRCRRAPRRPGCPGSHKSSLHSASGAAPPRILPPIERLHVTPTSAPLPPRSLGPDLGGSAAAARFQRPALVACCSQRQAKGDQQAAEMNAPAGASLPCNRIVMDSARSQVPSLDRKSADARANSLAYACPGGHVEAGEMPCRNT